MPELSKKSILSLIRNLWVKLVMVFMIGSFAATAQYKTFELEPIQKQGWRYYYDFKKVSTPLALQIPLLTLGDEQVVRQFKTFKGLQFASDIVFLLPAMYILVGPGGVNVSPEL